MHLKKRSLVLAGSAGLLLLATPTTSHAFGLGLFDWLFHHEEKVVTVPLASCNPCAPTATYAARTSYRLRFVNVPVTTMRPVASCDPCSGTQVTAYRPTTTYVRRLRFVPTTTYRPIATTTVAAKYAVGNYAAPAAVSSCATGNCGTAAPAPTYYTPTTYAPTVANYAPASANCCGSTAAPTLRGFSPAPATTYTPSSSSYAPATTYTPSPTPAPTYSQPSATYSQPAPSSAQPTPAEPPATAEPRTFKRESLDEEQSQPQQQSTPAPAEQQTEKPQLQPVPDSSIKSSGGLFRAPRLVDPKDKAASAEHDFQVRPAVHVQPAPMTQEEIDAQGWRPAPGLGGGKFDFQAPAARETFSRAAGFFCARSRTKR
jgi:hypothetical protein